MSPNDGTTAGPKEVGDALVAALGFEPTKQVAESATGNGNTERRAVDDVDAPRGQERPPGGAGDVARGRDGDRPAGDAAAYATPTESDPDQGRTLSAEDWVGAARPETGQPIGSSPADIDSSGAKPLPLLPDFLRPANGAVDAGPPTAPVEMPMAPSAPVPQSESGRVDHLPSPVVSPPPPYVGDHLPTYGATTGDVAVVRSGGLTKNGAALRAGELAARVPELFERGLKNRSHRVRARKVRRVVRHVDPWSMLTFSVLFHLCVYAALLLASVLVWNAAAATGWIENIESFIRELGDYQTYEIQADVVFRAAMVIAGILTLASSVLVVLLTVIFNLISDLVGGIRLTVVEEETVRVRRHRNQ
jgi:hypothetical protein